MANTPHSKKPAKKRKPVAKKRSTKKEPKKQEHLEPVTNDEELLGVDAAADEMDDTTDNIVEVEEKTDQDQLFDLYTDDDDDTLDMTKLDQQLGKRNVFVLFGVIIIVLSAIAALLGYLVLGPEREAKSSGGIEVQLTYPETVASGDQVSITLTYKNTMNVAIEQGNIELVYPQGFYPLSTQPESPSDQMNRWQFADLPAGTSGSVTITGQMVGQVDDEKNFTALITYTPSNFSSDFQTTQRWSMVVNKSILDLTVTVPDRLRSGEEFDYDFSINNTASLPLSNVRAKLLAPSTYKATSADPAATDRDDTWEYEEFGANSTEEVKVTGAIDADGGTDQEFILQVGIVEPNGRFNLQAELPVTIRVIDPELSLSVTAPESASAGDALDYEITVKNTSSTSVEQLKLQLAFTEGVFEINDAELATIDELQPGQSKTLEYSVSLPDPLPDGVGEVEAEVSILNADIEGRSVDFDTKAKIRTGFSGDISAQLEARYFADDLTKVGSGPLPPKQGEVTSYQLTAIVSAQGTGLSEVALKLSLPEYVTATDLPSGATTEGDVLNIPLENIAAGSSRQIQFTIEAQPKAKQVGKLLVLISSGAVNAVDANSDAVVQKTISQVTAKLSSDPGFSSGDETVVAK